MTVSRPGSRGGRFWVDEHGNVRYGMRPRGARPAPSSAPPAPVPQARNAPDAPHHQEFGAWAPDATALYVHQALRFAPCLANVIQRYLDMVSRYGMGAAASEAMKLMTPEDAPAATAALGRMRRLAHWDRHGRVKNEGQGTSLPSGLDDDPTNAQRNPFVQAAMQRGMPKDAALLWQQLLLRCMNDGQSTLEGDGGAQQMVGNAILTKSTMTFWSGGRLLKATANPGSVAKPGSRGGHVYWQGGRLHYGTPAGPSSRRRSAASTALPTWQAPGPMARALMRQGRRVQYRNTLGVKVWGDVITASGEVLSVLPDDAKPYDLLHTIALPVSLVLQVAADESDTMEKSHDQTPLAHASADPAPGHRPAEDTGCWPETY